MYQLHFHNMFTKYGNQRFSEFIRTPYPSPSYSIELSSAYPIFKLSARESDDHTASKIIIIICHILKNVNSKGRWFKLKQTYRHIPIKVLCRLGQATEPSTWCSKKFARKSVLTYTLLLLWKCTKQNATTETALVK